MKKKYLLAPGPTPIPESVLAVLSLPIIHHRTPEFKEVIATVRSGLKQIFQTQQEVLLLSSSGTGAMEACIQNLFSPGEKAIVVNTGKFGERWTRICQTYGLETQEVRLNPGESLSIEKLQTVVHAHSDARAILFQASETSTGLKLPVQEICRIAQEAKMLSVCDGITACGVMDLPMDKWSIDVLISGSQKAFMVPPGLAFAALSERAWACHEAAALPRFYFDFTRERKAILKNQTAWTPAIQLMVGLKKSLEIMQAEGLVQIFQRHETLARATRAGIRALGLELLAKDSPSPSVTAVRVPPQITDGTQIPKRMRDHYGVTIAGGQDQLEGKIFRLSHFGYCDRFDITTGLSALELTLNDLGYPVELGRGVGAALRVFQEHAK